MLRREFGLTDEELLDKWNFWQSIGYMDAAAELLKEMNRTEPTPPSSSPDAHVVDARKHVDIEQLKMLGFNIAEKGG